jgi:hypothetical protein
MRKVPSISGYAVLGSFLFLIYIHDIVDDLDCNIKLFADDTSVYVIVDEQNYIQAADMLSTDFSHIHSEHRELYSNMGMRMQHTICLMMRLKSFRPEVDKSWQSRREYQK